jgi:hypothetical protein
VIRRQIHNGCLRPNTTFKEKMMVTPREFLDALDRDDNAIDDLKGDKTSEFRVVGKPTSSSDLVDRDSMADAQFASFIAGIGKGEKLKVSFSIGNIAATIRQLSNIGWAVKRELGLDAPDGRTRDDSEAMKMWGRKSEPEWASHV